LIVCHCEVVNDRAVVEAIEAGSRTLSGVCRATGAGKNCGMCVFSLKRLLCQHGQTLTAQPAEVEVAAS
jgi:bacterioferritin-associated ferredoxin